MTERLESQKRLRFSELRYRRLFEVARDGVLILDSVSRKITDANPFITELLGYAREELLGKELWQIGLLKDEQASHAAFRELQQQGLIRYEDLPLQTKSGEKREVEMVANLYEEDGKRVIQYNIRDITERKQAEEALRRAQKMESVGTLASGVAHDFNNLLAIVMAHAAELKNHGLKAEEFSESIDAILAASQQGAAVVRELQTFARNVSVSRSSVELAELLPEFTRMIERTFPRTIEIELNLQPDLPAIQANATQIQQALLNLCVNSRDAMPEGGKLAICVARETRSEAGMGDCVRISVADTGVGMDNEVRTRIFDPFFTTKEKQGGTGLGLAVTYGIVRDHGGFLEVESAKDKGTEFRLYLPVRSENASMKEGELGQ
ncbi:MAG: PAS domain S-box protein [Deltaproteobacteria bacterium]|nr:PAS domain S-box protein [Deltaproteobacteria bacterium]